MKTIPRKELIRLLESASNWIACAQSDFGLKDDGTLASIDNALAAVEGK